MRAGAAGRTVAVMSTPSNGSDRDADVDEPTEDAPRGGDETTEEQLDADNAAEAETLKTLDPDNPAA